MLNPNDKIAQGTPGGDKPESVTQDTQSSDAGLASLAPPTTQKQATTPPLTTSASQRVRRTVKIGEVKAETKAKSIRESFKRFFDSIKSKLAELNAWLKSDASLADKAETAFRNLAGASFAWFGTVLKFAAFYAAATAILPVSLAAAAPILAALATHFVPVRFAIPLMMLNGIATVFSLPVRAFLAFAVPYAFLKKDEMQNAEVLEQATEEFVVVKDTELKVGGVTVAEEETAAVRQEVFNVKRIIQKPVNPEITEAFNTGVQAADNVIARARGAYQAVSERFGSSSRPAQTV